MPMYFATQPKPAVAINTDYHVCAKIKPLGTTANANTDDDVVYSEAMLRVEGPGDAFDRVCDYQECDPPLRDCPGGTVCRNAFASYPAATPLMACMLPN